MRKIREVLRLFFDAHLTKRQIATSCNVARSTVAEYLRRFAVAGLSWQPSVGISGRDHRNTQILKKFLKFADYSEQHKKSG